MSLSAGHAHHSCAVEKREAGLRQLGNKLLHFLLLLCLHLLDRFVDHGNPMSLNLYTILQEGRRGGEGRGGGGGGGGGGEGRGANAQARERLASFRRAANA